MSVKNDPPKNQAEIGEALVAALGFEPTDAKKLGRSSGKGANGSNASKNDGKESAAEPIISDSSADGSTVAKADSSNTESTKSSDADSSANKNGATESNGSTGTASRSSSKARSRKKSKKTSSGGAYESRKSRSSKLRSSIEGNTASNDTSGDATSSAVNETDKSVASSDTSSKSDSKKDSSRENKTPTSDSEDATSPIDVATQTRRVSTLPPPPNEDSIRTPGLGDVDGAKRSEKTDTKDSTSDKVKAKTDSKAEVNADASSKSANQSVKNKQGAHSSNKNGKTETVKAAPVAEADFTPPAPPAGVAPSADTEVLPTTPATIEPNGTPPTTPPTAEAAAPVVEAAPAQTTPRVTTRPNVAGPSFFGGRRKVQARKVRRVVRHIDPWSVLIFSVLFHLCIAAALLIASVLVWNAAEAAGTIEQIEDFIRELGDYETFVIDGETIFRAAVGIAGVMTLASSVLLVLLTVMFNLISDLVGGIRVTVIEEETIRVKRK